MARGWYEKLSVLDEAFLAFETPEAYMHVAVTSIFEPASLAKVGGGIEIKRIRSYIASRLHLLPRYRQRLMPRAGEPPARLGRRRRLRSQLSRAPHRAAAAGRRTPVAAALRRDPRTPARSRPAALGAVVHRRLGGGRFAMVGKVHHCMVDGIAGVGILAALLGVAPSTTIEKTERWRPRPIPRKRDLLERRGSGRAKTSLEMARNAPTPSPADQDAARSSRSAPAPCCASCATACVPRRRRRSTVRSDRIAASSGSASIRRHQGRPRTRWAAR